MLKWTTLCVFLDYVLGNTSSTFSPGSNSGTIMQHTVTILQDVEYEGTKRFHLIITGKYERILIQPRSTVIEIIDYNGQLDYDTRVMNYYYFIILYSCNTTAAYKCM